ncbi:MAG: ATP-dependent metallopeptidase FtsH/Yme1/Tma family protein, partial [Candidatus Omnitrophota bacterium]
MANGHKRKKNNNQSPVMLQRIVISLVILMIVVYFSGVFNNESLSLQQPREISLSEFTGLVAGNGVDTAVKRDYVVQGKLKDGSLYKVYITEFDPDLVKLMRDHIKDFRVNVANPFFANFFWPILFPLIVLMFFWYVL